ncbi:MAG: hypothetical protein D6736_08735 [Nitrospinota bacterium]|nr:MAG: hypothetical protein D6736_08735 [Nitrospinota bacterium]
MLEEAAADQETAAAPATLIFTALYWRSAWKYRSRAYRYCFWDAGTMAAHALALATALSLPARLITAFIDALVEQLLGLDRKEEGVLFLMPLGRASSPPLPAPPLSPLPVHALPLSQREVDYPLISQMHTASALETREEVERWRDRISPLPPLEDAPLFPLPSLSAVQSSSSPLGEVILKRGSTRRFLPESIPLSALATLLTAGSGEIEADFLPGRGSLVHSYLISNGVQGLPSGAYVFHPARHGLQLLREGSFRQEAGYLCLEQPLGATASVVIFFLADFDALLERYGNRGYRVAQLEAGIRGGRLYLAAYALGLGATGLTFYDDVVVEFFSPHAQGKIPLLAVAIGVPAPIKRSRIVPLRPDRTPGTF